MNKAQPQEKKFFSSSLVDKRQELRSLDDIALMRAKLENRADKSERRLAHDVEQIQSQWKKSFSFVHKMRNITRTILPKMEYITLLTPFVKRLFKRKR